MVPSESAIPYVVEQGEKRLRVLATAGRRPGKELLRRWELDKFSGKELTQAMGYGVAIEYGWEGELRVWADIGGFYPAYYWSNGEVMVCASSPTFADCHEDFRRKVDTFGIVTQLTLGHGGLGRTLWEGVRQMRPCHELQWRRGSEAKEEALDWYSTKIAYRDVGEAAQAFGEELEKSTQLWGGRQACLMLSGGIDSRLMAGALRKNWGTNYRAITLGSEEDQEYKIASQVARHLGVAQKRVEVPLEKYDEWMDLQLESCQGTSGVTNFANWAVGECGELDKISLVSGLVGEQIMGGRIAHDVWNAQTGVADVQILMQRMVRFGLAVGMQERLLRIKGAQEMRESIEQAILRDFERYEGAPFQKAIRLSTEYRLRHHSGREAWRWGQAALPRLPFLDPEVQRIGAQMPYVCTVDREVQKRLLIDKYPDLARLPLDRNSLFIRPLLVDGLGAKLRWAMQQRLYIKKNVRKLSGKEEFRYYYRVYSLNYHPGWIRLRDRARSVARKFSDIFDPEVVEKLIPAGAQDVEEGTSIVESAGRKVLIGQLLWLEKFA
ncbi:MAG: asparagine synthase-related protein [Bryobacter sp.]|nr:asparagine synthase-related protein [Bryobacter sp.]